jgi:hypothetical protein
MSSHDAHSGMNEPTIICPNCKTEIKLTESLAAPLIEATRQGYEQKIAQKEADVANREAAIREQQASGFTIRNYTVSKSPSTNRLAEV